MRSTNMKAGMTANLQGANKQNFCAGLCKDKF